MSRPGHAPRGAQMPHSQGFGESSRIFCVKKRKYTVYSYIRLILLTIRSHTFSVYVDGTSQKDKKISNATPN